MDEKKTMAERRRESEKALPIPSEIAKLWHELDGWYCRTQDKELCGPYDSREELLADFRDF